MSPEQEIRVRVRTLLGGLGYPIVSFTPNESESFPMIHVGEQFKQNERTNIDKLNGSTQITIHIWHNDTRQEGTVMKITSQIERVIIDEFNINGEDISTHLLMDDSTGVYMLHGVMEINIKY